MALLNIPAQEALVATLAIDHDVITNEQATALITRCRAEGLEPLAELIASNKRVRDDLLKAIAEELGYPYFDMANAGTALKADPALLENVPMDSLERYAAIPMSANEAGTVVIVIADPTDPTAKQVLSKIYEQQRGMKISYAVASPFHIRRELATLRTKMQSEAISRAAAAEVQDQELQDLLRAPDDDSVETSPVVNFVTNLLVTAVHRRAADVHIDPNPDGSYQAYYRVDGIRQRAPDPPRHREPEVIAQILHRADMDPSNLRFPQDGRLKFSAHGRAIDGRVSMVPCVGGPKMTVRLLDPSNLDLALEDMGFSRTALDILRRNSNHRQGTILVSGPTGSGKTTTLYSLLREVQTIEKNIMTIEDPVEYQIMGLNQIQVAKSETQGVTFAGALRAVMRSDPDVILVGEIRDAETAKIAADAAITGHLVLSTIHASSAIETFTRFIEMGVPAYMAAEALSVTTAQRLMRRVCQCAELESPSTEELAALERIGLEAPQLVAHTRGCGICNGVGYWGRLAIAEVLEISDDIRRLIATRAPIHEIRQVAADEGFISLAQDGFRHVKAQRTTISEYMRVVDLGGGEEHIEEDLEEIF